MTGAETSWQFADAWVFAAIAVYHRPCSLAEMLASADWINHAVPSEGEIETALGRLAGSDLLRIFEDWTLELTDEGMSLWTSGTRDIEKQLELVQEQLAEVEPGRIVVRLPPGALA